LSFSAILNQVHLSNRDDYIIARPALPLWSV
jgi:hypothetical protein